MSIDMPCGNYFAKGFPWLIFFSDLEWSNKYFGLFFCSHGLSVVYDSDKKHKETRLLATVFQKQPKESGPLRACFSWFSKHLDRLSGTDAFWQETSFIFANKCHLDSSSCQSALGIVWFKCQLKWSRWSYYGTKKCSQAVLEVNSTEEFSLCLTSAHFSCSCSNV